MKNITNNTLQYSFAIRADGSEAVGKGHLMRASVLLKSFQKKKQKVVLVTVDNEFSQSLFQDSQDVVYIDHEDYLNPKAWPVAYCYLVDLYEFGEELYKAMKQSTCNAVFVFDDEVKELPLSVDGVINHNVYASANDYSDRLIRLCGSQYFLLRPEMAYSDIQVKRGNGVFICMGGSDPEKQTYRMTSLVREACDRPIDVVIGTKDNALQKALEKLEDVNIHLNPGHLSMLMRQSAFAISGAGTMAYELAYCGTPSILVHLAENQCRIGEAFQRAHVSLTTGAYNEVSDQGVQDLIIRMDQDLDFLTELSEKAKGLIDGRGADRLSDELIGYSQQMPT